MYFAYSLHARTMQSLPTPQPPVMAHVRLADHDSPNLLLTRALSYLPDVGFCFACACPTLRLCASVVDSYLPIVHDRCHVVTSPVDFEPISISPMDQANLSPYRTYALRAVLFGIQAEYFQAKEVIDRTRTLTVYRISHHPPRTSCTKIVKT